MDQMETAGKPGRQRRCLAWGTRFTIVGSVSTRGGRFGNNMEKRNNTDKIVTTRTKHRPWREVGENIYKMGGH
jgi:hypothetical protein